MNLSLEESESLVLALTKAYSETILILDALDETDVEDREDLMETIDRLVSQSANLKVLISSRRDNDIKRRLKLKANLSVEATDNRDDISKFVREKIEDAQQGRHGTSQSPRGYEMKSLQLFWRRVKECKLSLLLIPLFRDSR